MNIIYKNQDGSIVVFTPTQEALGMLTPEDIAQRVVPKGSDYQIVDPSALPTDRTFRDAWEINTNTIDVNISKAKEISHSKRREARAAEFAPLDIRTTIPTLAEQAESERQLVRDKYAAIQTQIDEASTIEEIKERLVAFTK